MAADPILEAGPEGGYSSAVNKLCTMGGAFIGSYVGWYLGDRWSGLGAAIVLSGVASLVGVYLGWKLARKLEE